MVILVINSESPESRFAAIADAAHRRPKYFKHIGRIYYTIFTRYVSPFPVYTIQILFAITIHPVAD